MTEVGEFLFSVAQKWQKRWHERRVYESNPDERRKFYITVAFPYPNSPFHLGHGRTYVVADVYARFMRARGFNVLFPMGFHYTGTPIIAMADDVAKGDRELLDIFQNLYRIPPDVIPKLADPLYMANYFKEDIKTAMHELGLAIDWRREFTTIDPEFSSFTVWQFKRLQERGYIVRGTHPVGWCPVHHIPVGMHDTKGDVEPEIGEFTLIYFRNGASIFPAATLRPETVFGVVGVWINPKENYVKAELGKSAWILSEKASRKLSFQLDLRIVETVKGSELVGLTLVNPVTGDEVKVMPGEFVDPMTGTGVVMSVPAHAPFDYFYLRKVNGSAQPVPVIAVEGMSELPAAEVVEKNRPKTDEDLKKLTEVLYRTEYNKGVMRRDLKSVPEYRDLVSRVAGKPVPIARDEVVKEIIAKGDGGTIYEIMNRPVYCRCGNEAVVKILKDQWFLDYGNPSWKDEARRALSKMSIVPQEFRKDFEYSIEWLDKRACARTRGLGTPLPWDKKWIIESLSDSTIYMAYYTVSHLIRDYGIKGSQLTAQVWDYVILGLGDPGEVSKSSGIPLDLLNLMRKEFTYWYPLDSRNSGRDLIPNHLTFFIFNHAAIFNEALWPRQIMVNGLLNYEGKKMSKSLRNIVPLRSALRNYGTDTVRVALVIGADLGSDVNFTDAMAKGIAEKLKRIHDQAKSISSLDAEDSREDLLPDKWIRSKRNSLILKVTKLMEEFDYRGAVTVILYEMDDHLKQYLDWISSMGAKPKRALLLDYFRDWVKMLSLFAPHLAEEIWSEVGTGGLVVDQGWSSYEVQAIDQVLEFQEAYYRAVVEDVNSILKVAKGQFNKLKLYVAGKEEYGKLREAIEVLSAGGNLRNLMERFKPKDRVEARSLQEIYEYAQSLSPEIRRFILSREFDELNALMQGASLISLRVGIKEVEVRPYADLDRSKYKDKKAKPLKPAIIVE
jgi:leucyl-tRNA synthetase